MNDCRQCRPSNRTYIQVTKRYKLPKENLHKYKSRIHVIAKELDALIYWYPNAISNPKTKKGYFGSDCQIQHLAKHFTNPDYVGTDLYILDIIWKCGNLIEQISQPFIEYNVSAAYGFSSIFTEKVLNDNGRRIKITIKLYKRIVKPDKLQCKIMKSKRMKQIKLKDYVTKQYQIKCNSRKLTVSIKNKQKQKQYFYNSRISSIQLDDILQQFAYKLGEPDLFNLIPTIDCFATSINYQKICKTYITEEMDFFSYNYDDLCYWDKHVAWVFPPLSSKITQLCLNKFKSRKMRGFLCVPYLPKTYKWYYRVQQLSKEYVQMNGRDKENDIFIANKSEIDRCTFDIIVYYFDFKKYKICNKNHNQ